MAGKRDRNLRSGDLHEELGIFLLKSVGLVAPVPRQEDVGNDAFVTLLRPEGSRRLLPDLSFLVQLKSASIPSVTYRTPEEVAWINALEVPLLIGRVNLEKARIGLFTTQRVHQIFLEHPYEEIELLLDPSEETSNLPNKRRANLGPAIHEWSIPDVSEKDFLAKSHAVLRPHIESLRRNRLLRGIQTQSVLQWQTGQPPSPHSEMILGSAQDNLTDTLREMIPHVRRLMTGVQFQKKYADFPLMLALFDLMRRWGADPDPGGALCMMVGYGAEGPEISVEDAIRIRHRFHLNGLDLSRLPVTNDSLAAIPGDVTALALKDTLLTDHGIRTLSRLVNLKRLNLDGTQVTDDGLQRLSELPNLEWVSVRGTQVTSNGIARLKAIRSAMEIIFE